MTSSTSFRALGTTALVAVTERVQLLHARGILAAQLDELDRACSRFRDDSQLAEVNANAGRRVNVGHVLADAVDAALAAARETGGIVDPTLGAHIRAAGYDRTFALVEAREGWTFEAAPLRRASWTGVELDRSSGTLLVPEHVELDLGATAKALAADRAARTIAQATGGGVLVSLGGDIAVAGDPPDGGWSIRVAESHAAPLSADGPCISIQSGGVATSATTERRWRTDQGEAHHVIDPRTGRPARTCWRAITVAASSCLEANVAATAAIVLAEDAVEWLRARGLTSRLVGTDGSVVHVAGWPAETEAA